MSARDTQPLTEAQLLAAILAELKALRVEVRILASGPLPVQLEPADGEPNTGAPRRT